MSGTILIGARHEIYHKSDKGFVHAIRELPARMASRLSFMTHDHHAVRDFVVREMPRQRRPMPPAGIAKVTGLDYKVIAGILSDLEKHLFFIVRNRDGEVTWAFPVTTTVTPHRLRFSTGERTFGA